MPPPSGRSDPVFRSSQCQVLFPLSESGISDLSRPAYEEIARLSPLGHPDTVESCDLDQFYHNTMARSDYRVARERGDFEKMGIREVRGKPQPHFYFDFGAFNNQIVKAIFGLRTFPDYLRTMREFGDVGRATLRNLRVGSDSLKRVLPPSLQWGVGLSRLHSEMDRLCQQYPYRSFRALETEPPSYVLLGMNQRTEWAFAKNGNGEIADLPFLNYRRIDILSDGAFLVTEVDQRWRMKIDYYNATGIEVLEASLRLLEQDFDTRFSRQSWGRVRTPLSGALSSSVVWERIESVLLRYDYPLFQEVVNRIRREVIQDTVPHQSPPYIQSRRR